MIKRSLHKIIIYSAISICLILGPASAGQRYGTPPPIVLSPDISAPWMLQLSVSTSTKRSKQGNQRVRIVSKPKHTRPILQMRTERKAARRTIPVFSRWAQQNNTSRYNTPKPRQVAFQSGTTNLSVSSAPNKRNSSEQMDPRFEPQIVSYSAQKAPGTVIIDTNEKFLYLVLDNGQARRYGVGVGKPGFEWTGTHKITRRAEWPDWRPPSEMIAREKKKGRDLPSFVEGGPQNPLGARALYLGSSLYRIHGTNQPWTIGRAVSSGCIRMRNEDVMDLYERIGVGTKVIVS
ncbi:MAG: L,D-transpeptidase [Hyphomicrobiales bacterium]|nr:L,D-transpeptidase [Hyphomicrobiales bacterium]